MNVQAKAVMEKQKNISKNIEKRVRRGTKNIERTVELYPTTKQWPQNTSLVFSEQKPKNEK